MNTDNDKIVETGDKCPLCGCAVLAYNNPSDDPSMTEWCSNEECDWIENQFLSYEDLRGCYNE